MISQMNSNSIRSAYTSNISDAKSTKSNMALDNSQKSDATRIDKIKESIDSGEYKVNLQALSEKIATELL